MLPSDWFSSANNCFREDSGFCGNSFLSPMLCRLVDLNSHVVVSVLNIARLIYEALCCCMFLNHNYTL